MVFRGLLRRTRDDGWFGLRRFLNGGLERDLKFFVFSNKKSFFEYSNSNTLSMIKTKKINYMIKYTYSFEESSEKFENQLFYYQPSGKWYD